ncbi:hypothetical protein BKA70DRAFT_1225767 [Coprinopsis sp. MPI-PUGE-AT-0042]|nr:hypothetical protein BKA70DRAFT_1225767 [Coprinopsis sp. MPI-PUGE-AT-0042]
MRRKASTPDDLRGLPERHEQEVSAMTTVDTSATLGLRVLQERLKPEESRRLHDSDKGSLLQARPWSSVCLKNTSSVYLKKALKRVPPERLKPEESRLCREILIKKASTPQAGGVKNRLHGEKKCFKICSSWDWDGEAPRAPLSRDPG